MKRLYSFLLITIVAFSLLASDCGCGKSDTGNTTSQLNATDYANKTVTDNTTKIASLYLTIYLEGWDHAVIDEAAACKFNLGLTFEIE